MTEPGAVLDADEIAAWLLALPSSPAAGGVSVSQAEAPAPATLAAATPAADERARTRIHAILSGEEAKTRPKFALKLAMNSNLTPEEAEGLLAAAGREVDETRGARMRLVPTPAIRPDVQQRSADPAAPPEPAKRKPS